MTIAFMGIDLFTFVKFTDILWPFYGECRHSPIFKFFDLEPEVAGPCQDFIGCFQCLNPKFVCHSEVR